MYEHESMTLEEEGVGQEPVVGAQEEAEEEAREGDLGSEDADREEEGGEDSGGEGEQAEEDPGDAGQGAEDKPAQSHADNQAARAARIRAEQETESRMRREYDDAVAAMGVTDPYTGKVISSFEEFKAYGARYRREQLAAEAARTGRTVEELEREAEDRAMLAQLRQDQKARKEAQAEAERRRAFLAKDLEDFLAAYPTVDVAALEKNPQFVRFAGSRLYHQPLKELYKDFSELVGQAQQAGAAKAAGKRERSTGGGQSGSGATLTPEQAKKLEEWNRENPELQMTAKEFLGR